MLPRAAHALCRDALGVRSTQCAVSNLSRSTYADSPSQATVMCPPPVRSSLCCSQPSYLRYLRRGCSFGAHTKSAWPDFTQVVSLTDTLNSFDVFTLPCTGSRSLHSIVAHHRLLVHCVTTDSRWDSTAQPGGAEDGRLQQVVALPGRTGIFTGEQLRRIRERLGAVLPWTPQGSHPGPLLAQSDTAWNSVRFSM